MSNGWELWLSSGLLCAALCCPHVPACGNILRRCLSDEVADNLCGCLVEVRRQIFELLPCRIIKPQYDACGIDMGIVGALGWCCLLPTGGEVLDGDLAHHVAEPGSSFHSCSGGCFLHLLMEFGCDV